MVRMSARFVALKINKNASWVYDVWKDIKLVVKDQSGHWILTELGRTHGGKMSLGQHTSVPTFDFDTVEHLMVDFFNKD